MSLDLSTPKLFVALNHRDMMENLRLAEKVAAYADGLKINDDAVDHAGLSPIVEPLLEFDLPLFVDEKNFKGAGTMASRAQTAAELGVTFINAYAQADHLLRGPVEALVGTQTILLAVTVLTHHGEEYCQRYFRRSLAESVRMLAETAVEFGCPGIILPGPTLSAVSDLNLIKVVPGIRPEGSERGANDQESTATPTEAVVGGANILIVGGPIANYPGGPEAGARRIREEMESALGEAV